MQINGNLEPTFEVAFDVDAVHAYSGCVKRAVRIFVWGVFGAVACGETERNFAPAEPTTGPSVNPSATSTANPTSETPGGEPTPSGPAGPSVTYDNDDSSTQATSEAVGSSDVPDASAQPTSRCRSTEYDALSINEPAELPGVRNVYFYGDGVTTACVTHTRDQVCIEGNARSSSDGMDEFKYWGVGLGMYLATAVPFDAKSQGITQVRFSVTNVTGRTVRIALTQVADPSIEDDQLNYPNNAFVYGGSDVNDVTTDTVVTAKLADFTLPNWTRFVDPDSGEPAVGQSLDSSQLASLQIQMVNSPQDTTSMYSYCVSALEWLDDDGMAVVPSVPEPEPEQ